MLMAWAMEIGAMSACMMLRGNLLASTLLVVPGAPAVGSEGSIESKAGSDHPQAAAAQTHAARCLLHSAAVAIP